MRIASLTASDSKASDQSWDQHPRHAHEDNEKNRFANCQRHDELIQGSHLFDFVLQFVVLQGVGHLEQWRQVVCLGCDLLPVHKIYNALKYILASVW